MTSRKSRASRRPLQHELVPGRRVEPPRDHPEAGDGPRPGPLRRRFHLPPANRQIRSTRIRCRWRRRSARWSRSRTSPPRPRSSKSRSRPPRARSSTPPTRRSTRPMRYIRALRRAEGAGLRADRPALPRHLWRADGDRIDPGRHRGRLQTYFVRGRSCSIPVTPASTPTRAPPTRKSRPRRGQQLAIEGSPWLVDKETQPPARLSEAKLVQLMDEQGLGTKATRPDIIQKLYNRRYVRNHPPEPTATGTRCTRHSRSTCRTWRPPR